MGWVICGVVGEHKHVCSKAYDAHDVAAVARFLVLGCCCCCCCSWVGLGRLLLLLLLQLGVGFELLLSKGPGSPEVLPCSAWAMWCW